MSFQTRNYEVTDGYITPAGSKRFPVGSPGWMVAKTSVEESPVAVQGTAPLPRCESSFYLSNANLPSVQYSVVDNTEFFLPVICCVRLPDELHDHRPLSQLLAWPLCLCVRFFSCSFAKRVLAQFDLFTHDARWTNPRASTPLWDEKAPGFTSLQTARRADSQVIDVECGTLLRRTDNCPVFCGEQQRVCFFLKFLRPSATAIVSTAPLSQALA